MVPPVLYIGDDTVTPPAGTAAGIDACLHADRADHGAAIAAEFARRLITPPHRDGGQAQYHRLPISCALGASTHRRRAASGSGRPWR